MSVPEEASAAMRTFARTMRDMYVALIAEGFTEREATKLISETIRATIAARRDD